MSIFLSFCGELKKDTPIEKILETLPKKVLSVSPSSLNTVNRLERLLSAVRY